MRAALGLGLVLVAGCGIDVGAPGEWVPASSIAGQLAPEIGMPARPTSRAAPTGTSFRIVTYNVHLGENVARLADEIQANPDLAAADVFLLQEEEAYPGEGSTRACRLAALLGAGWIYMPGRMKSDGTHGLAMLSRYPIENAAMMTLPTTDDWKPRIAMRADIVVGDVRVLVVNVHLETRINVTDRILQIRPAVIDLPDDAIVAGDVNTNPFMWEDGEIPILPTSQVADTDQAPILDDYMRAIGFDTPVAGVGYTHEVLGIRSRLDAIYVRGYQTKVAHVERDLDASDHFPVWLDVTLK